MRIARGTRAKADGRQLGAQVLSGIDERRLATATDAAGPNGSARRPGDRA